MIVLFFFLYIAENLAFEVKKKSKWKHVDKKNKQPLMEYVAKHWTACLGENEKNNWKKKQKNFKNLLCSSTLLWWLKYANAIHFISTLWFVEEVDLLNKVFCIY